MSRIALVTGGSRGIGASISKRLKQDGFTVAATYAGNDVAAASFTAETGIKSYRWDVSSYEESKSGIEKVESELGPVDVVVANAGILRDAPFHRMTPEQWNEVIATNLTGVFNTVHPVWPGMRERKFGRVIVISSINGQKGQFAQVNYSATKAGDLGIVKKSDAIIFISNSGSSSELKEIIKYANKNSPQATIREWQLPLHYW